MTMQDDELIQVNPEIDRWQGVPRASLVRLEAIPSTGGARYVMTPMGYECVRDLASRGLAHKSIAAYLRMGRDAFRHLRERDPELQAALDEGLGTCEGKLRKVLVDTALSGKANSFIAATIALKMLYHYRDHGGTPATEDGGGEGASSPVVVVPAQMSLEEWVVEAEKLRESYKEKGLI